LEEIFTGEEVLAALASSNANDHDHEQITPSAYEWRVWSSYDRDSRKALTGEEIFFGESENKKNEQVTTWRIEIEENFTKWNYLVIVKPRKYPGVLSAFVFATGCAALTALIMLVWSYVDEQQKAKGEVKGTGMK